MRFMQQIPNALIGLRFALIPAIVLLTLESGQAGYKWLAVVLLVAAAVTDVADGQLARRWGSVTTFGKLADPLADKLLVGATLIALASLDRVAAWVVGVILTREVVVTLLRVVAASAGITIAAQPLGKLKTLFQGVMVLGLVINQATPLWLSIWIYLTVAITLISGGSIFAGWLRRPPSTLNPRSTLGRSPDEMQATSSGMISAHSNRRQFFDGMCDRLAGAGLRPNHISLAGFVLNLVAAGLIIAQQFWVGGLVFLVGSLLDTLDGRYARRAELRTKFGAFLDSTLDRIEEGVVLAAIAVYFASQRNQLGVALVVLAVLASLTVSYTRARAEALGVECKTGLATRPIRVTILTVALIVPSNPVFDLSVSLTSYIALLAGLAILTVGQRIWHVYRCLQPKTEASST